MNKNPKTLDLRNFLPYRISLIEQQISRCIADKYSEQHDLGRFEWRVLATLAMFEDITAKDICEFTLLEKMQVSRAISGLQRKKMITQKKKIDDSRSTLLKLSTKGRTIYQQIVPRVLEEEKRLFSILSDEELEFFCNIVNKLCQSIRLEQ
jgi:DNA-binding MarR family transcriptional regulator